MPTEIENRFLFHPPRTDAEKQAHAQVRVELRAVALYLAEELPDGREKIVALTKLEEAMFWANASIARQRTGREEAGQIG